MYSSLPPTHHPLNMRLFKEVWDLAPGRLLSEGDRVGCGSCRSSPPGWAGNGDAPSRIGKGIERKALWVVSQTPLFPSMQMRCLTIPGTNA